MPSWAAPRAWRKDIPPYVKAAGSPMQLYGLNAVGLQRRGFSEEVRRELKRAYRLFFASTYNTTQALARAREELRALPEIEVFLSFFEASESGRVRLSGTAALPVGVIGVGSLGFHHARILRDVPGAEMVGVYDSDPERRARWPRSWGFAAFGSAEELARPARMRR